MTKEKSNIVPLDQAAVRRRKNFHFVDFENNSNIPAPTMATR